MNRNLDIDCSQYLIRGAVFMAALLFLLCSQPGKGWAQYLDVPALTPNPNYKFPPRGISGDLWADLVLGQTDIGNISPNQATSNTVWSAGGVVVDAPHNILYTFDGSNNRVLGVVNISEAHSNFGPSDPPCTATILIGQPDFTHTGCNWDANFQDYPNPTQPTSFCLCVMPQNDNSVAESFPTANLAVDSSGDLYVPDYSNNRVLRYDFNDLQPALTPGAVVTKPGASHVWGQGPVGNEFFTSLINLGGSAPTSYSLSFHGVAGYDYNVTTAGVAVDSQGNLWVADLGNNRVLRFPGSGSCCVAPSNGADLVLGQSNFNLNVQAGNVDDTLHMSRPVAVRVDSAGNVYVADNPPAPGEPNGAAGRILVYEATPAVTPAQYTYASSPSATLNAYFLAPKALEWDVQNGVTDGLWVSDYQEQQVVLLPVSTSNPSNFLPASKVLLRDVPWIATTTPTQPPSNFTCSGVSITYSYPVGNLQSSCSGVPYGVGVDQNGNVYVGFSQYSNTDVWRFPNATPIPNPTPGSSWSADLAVFKPAQYRMVNKMGLGNFTGESATYGIAVADHFTSSPQIIAADVNRLLFWNIPPGGVTDKTNLYNGKNADGVAGNLLGAETFKVGTKAFGRMRTDDAIVAAMTPTPNFTPIPHLWTCRVDNGTLEVYQLPLQPYATPIATIAPPIAVLGSSNLLTWDKLVGIAVDPQLNIWVSDNTNSRILHIRNPLTSNPVVDIILGQNSASATQINQGQGEYKASASSLFSAQEIAMDHHGDLFVCDFNQESSGNGRILRFDKATIQNNSNKNALFGIPASAVFGRNGNFSTGFGDCLPNPTGNTNMEVCHVGSLAFNQDDSLMVVGENGYSSNWFPVVFTNPTLPQTVLTSTGQDWPVTYLQDFYSGPTAITFDKDGNLFVGDYQRSRLLAYYHPFPSPTPTLTPTLGVNPMCTPTPNWVNNIKPYGIAANNSYIYEADQTSDCVNVFPQGSGTGSQICNNNLKKPFGVAADNNYVYVTDQTQNEVFVFPTPGGTPIASWGIIGSRPGEFNKPSGIAVTVNTSSVTQVYVADTGNHRIEIFSLDGQWHASTPIVWGTPGNIGHGTFNTPTGIALDSQGNIYVADSTTGLVQVFNPQRVFLFQWDATMGSTTPCAEFITIQGCLVFVSDGPGNGHGNVRVFQLNGSPVNSVSPVGIYPGGSDTEGLAIGPNSGTLYVADFSIGNISAYTKCSWPTCVPTVTPPMTWNPATAVPTYIPSNTPTNIITVSPTFTGTLSTNTPTPFETLTPTNTFTYFPTNTPINTPSPTPVLCSVSIFPSSLTPYPVTQPYGLASDGTNIYVADQFANQIIELGSSGSFINEFGYDGTTNYLTEPLGVAADGNGVYVTDETQNELFIFNTHGSAPNVTYGSEGGGLGQFESPAGIAVTTANGSTTIFVADQYNMRVQEFTWAGGSSVPTPVAQWGSEGIMGNGTFVAPTGIAIDNYFGTGYVFVSDWETGLVQVFNPLNPPQNQFMWQWDATLNTPLLGAEFIVQNGCLFYVSDGFGNIGVFDLYGNYQDAISVPGGFYNVEGLAAEGGSLFAADYGLGQIDQIQSCSIPTCVPTSYLSRTPTFTPIWTPTNTPTPNLTSVCCQVATDWLPTPTFSTVMGVAVDRWRGRVYVADNNDGILQAMDYWGNPISGFAGLENGKLPLNSAWDVAMGNCGNDYVYVVTRGASAGDSLNKLNPSGTPVATAVLGSTGPRALNVDNNGNAYIATDQNNIQIFNSNLTPVATIGPNMGSLGSLSAPSGLVKLGPNLYVSDTMNNRVVLFPETTPNTNIYGTPTPIATIGYPCGLTADLNGNFYVTTDQQGVNGYDIYDSGFNFKSACANSQIVWPFGIGVDENGAAYVGAGVNGVVKMKPCYIQSPVPTCTTIPTRTYTSTPTPTNILYPCAVSFTFPAGYPEGVAMDNAGSIYVADEDAGVVDVYNPNWSSTMQIGAGYLTQPFGVALDGAGNIYVTDVAQKMAYEFDLHGALITEWSLPGTPGGIAVYSPNQYVYIVDQDHQEVDWYEFIGGQFELQNYWNGTDGSNGSNGSHGQRFVNPEGVAASYDPNDLSHSYVYVSDWGTGLVQAYNDSGSLWVGSWDVTKDPNTGTPTGLLGANFIGLYKNCLAYVSDGYGSVGFFQISFTGNSLNPPLNKGTNQGPFYDTEGIGVGNGTWAVADIHNDMTGQVDAFGPCPNVCWSPTNTPTNTPTWTTAYTHTPTYTFTYTQTYTYTYTYTYTCPPTAPPNIVWSTPTPQCCQIASEWVPTPVFNTVNGVAVDRWRGRVYVADKNDGIVQAMNYTGKPVNSFGGVGTALLPNAWDVAMGNCGNDFVYAVTRAGTGSSLNKFNPAGTPVATVGIATNTRAINVDINGNAYVAADDSVIRIFNSSLTPVATLGPNMGCLGSLYLPSGLMKVGSNLYVSDTNNNRIVVFPETTPNTNIYGTPTPVAAVGYPYEMTTDLNGNIYLVSQGLGGYAIFNPSLTSNITTCDNGYTGGSWGIAVDEKGAVYLGVAGSSSVVKMQPCISSQSPVPSCTHIPTRTPTPINTPTWTYTYTPNNTNTHSPTPNTPTKTPTPTYTYTPNKTTTHSPTPNTPTKTPTPTYTYTPNKTTTHSPTPNTPTKTPTPTYTYTPNKTTTHSPTPNTPTRTPTPTFTFTYTPTKGTTPGIAAQGNEKEMMLVKGCSSSTPTPAMEGILGKVIAAPSISRGGEAVQIRFILGHAAKVTLKIYTVAGRLVYEKQALSSVGSNKLAWQVENQRNQIVANGLYFYMLQAEAENSIVRKTGKIIVLR